MRPLFHAGRRARITGRLCVGMIDPPIRHALPQRQAGLLIGRERLLRLSSAPSLTPIALDDFKRARDELPAQAKRLVEENAERLEAFFDIPRPPVTFFHGPLTC